MAPEGSHEHAFFSAVHQELARRMPTASALLPPDAAHRGKLSIEASPLRITWVSNDRRCITTGRGVRHVLTYDAGGVHVHTADGAPVDDCCPYAIDLLHLSLDYLAERYTKVDRKRLVEALLCLPSKTCSSSIACSTHSASTLRRPMSKPRHKETEKASSSAGRCSAAIEQWAIRPVWTRPTCGAADSRSTTCTTPTSSATPSA